jgi:hypothetical protein
VRTFWRKTKCLFSREQLEGLRKQAMLWVQAELTTLGQILAHQHNEVPDLEAYLLRLEAGMAAVQNSPSENQTERTDRE